MTAQPSPPREHPPFQLAVTEYAAPGIGRRVTCGVCGHVVEDTLQITEPGDWR